MICSNVENEWPIDFLIGNGAIEPKVYPFFKLPTLEDPKPTTLAITLPKRNIFSGDYRLVIISSYIGGVH